tara:strand:- start:600 stop:1874 length:1275 start_codon:yes stop_codon:yes gene_type:complete
MSEIKSLRGMNDVIPSDLGIWQSIEECIRSSFRSYGYEEIRFPIVEKTELFSRSVGDSNDIVSKEMYSFKDRGDNGISLRPEGTAGCVRACIENNLLRVDSPRLWYMGPMFRYERPQKGRSRQFHQASAEVFGIDNHFIDAELIMLTHGLWTDLGIEDNMLLKINSLGSYETRKKYINLLIDFFQPFEEHIDKGSQRILKENPLRILDSKSEEIKKIVLDAPKILDCLDKESEDHFNGLKEVLNQANIPYAVDSNLVRGLDYYNKTVFEWKTQSLGAQDTICGGGRYDSLVEQLGGKSCPAVGFSIGLERLVMLVESLSSNKQSNQPNLDAYFICLTEESFSYAIINAQEIRKKLPGINLKVNLEATSANSQFKKADKSGAKFALIVGEQELKDNTISFKNLRNNSSQEVLRLDQLLEKIKNIL